MSAATITIPEVSAVHATRYRRHGLILLFAVIVVTSVTACALALVSYLWPLGHGEQPTLADLASHRTYAWAFFTVAGVQLVIGVSAAAIAGLLLAPARGARLATIGATMLFFGAAAYGVGIGGWAAAYWFASDTDVLGRRTASEFVDRINHDASHLLVLPIAGALVVAVGSLVLVAGIWRARTVPRKLLAATALSTVVTVILPPDSFLGVVAEMVSSATTIATGWYAVRLWTTGARGEARTARPHNERRASSLSAFARTTVVVIAVAAIIAPLALAGGEPKNERPFTQATLVDAVSHSGSPVIQGEAKNESPFTQPATFVVAASDHFDWKDGAIGGVAGISISLAAAGALLVARRSPRTA